MAREGGRVSVAHTFSPEQAFEEYGEVDMPRVPGSKRACPHERCVLLAVVV
jgi:hypothetical protein